jgi:Cell wall-active antibiotics response 4TMS YvqF
MSEKPSPQLTLTRERREHTIKTLVAGFAADRIPLEELERRLDVAHRTPDLTELDRLVADLPAAEAAAAPAPRQTAPPSEVRDQSFVVAIMGGVAKTGRWTPARRTHVLAFMGGAEIDLREAILPPGEIEIAVFTIWGGVEIIVPPGTEVDVSGVAVMGAFEQHRGTTAAPSGGPCVRVTGFALMAGVEVFVRYPGETARDARRRLKEERKSRGRELPSE